MDESAKKAFIYVSVSVLIFLIYKNINKIELPSKKNTDAPKSTLNANGSKRPFINMPTELRKANQDAATVLQAFILAYNNNEPETELLQLNNDFKNNYGLYIIKYKNEICVFDENDTKVLVYKIEG
jgi:hypothetical protein